MGGNLVHSLGSLIFWRKWAWRLRGFAFGALIGSTALYLVGTFAPAPLDSDVSVNRRSEGAQWVAVRVSGQLFEVDPDNRITFTTETMYGDINGLIESALIGEFVAGNRDSAFRMIDAIPDNKQRSAALFRLVERARALSAYRNVIAPELFGMINNRHMGAMAIAPPPSDETANEFLNTRKHDQETNLKKELEATKEAEKAVIDAAAGTLSRAIGIAPTIENKQDRAAILFAVAENQRKLRRVDASQQTFETGILALESSHVAGTFLGFGIGAWLGAIWTVAIGLATVLRDLITDAVRLKTGMFDGEAPLQPTGRGRKAKAK